MKRLAIFAHYDLKNIIDPYVVSYLEELKKYTSDIIFVSDGDLPESEADKVKHLSSKTITKKHSSYDFGSYRIGFEYVLNDNPQKFQEIDELLFVNDSCYLVGDLEEVFTGTSKKDDYDCWGMIDDYHSFNKGIAYYIGSFFIAFRKSVFQEKFFIDFIKSTKNFSSRNEIISKCEFGMSELLLRNNKKLFAYYNMQKTARYIAENHLEISNDIYRVTEENSYLGRKKILHSIINDVCNVHTYNYLHSNKFYVLLKMGFPLIKRRNIQYKSFTRRRLMFLWEEVLRYMGNIHNIDQIKNDCSRIGTKIKSKKIISSRLNYFLYLLSIARFFYKKRSVSRGRNVIVYKILFFKIRINV